MNVIVRSIRGEFYGWIFQAWIFEARAVFERRASCVHNVLAVKFAMRHCKQCVSNEASKRSRGPVRNWDVNFSSFQMCLPWHVPTLRWSLSRYRSLSLSPFLSPTRFFNFFFFSLSPPIRVIRTDTPISTMQTWIVTRVIWVIVCACVCVWKIKWIDACSLFAVKCNLIELEALEPSCITDINNKFLDISARIITC